MPRPRGLLAAKPPFTYLPPMSLARLILIAMMLLALPRHGFSAESPEEVVYVVPIREDIMPPLKYLVRRGVKEAMEAKADVLILDMDTNGGRVDTTEEIIEVINQFKGRTVTYIDRKAFSAGAFIAIATQEIYMAPQSVIGAATPVMLVPGGGMEQMPESYEAKITSAVRAQLRTSAEKNGHNIEVVDAMVDRNKEVKIGDEVISEKGELLTLTNIEAEQEYGEPPKPLLSLGTVSTLEELLEQLGLEGAKIVRVEPTGAEKVASWLTTISPLLLLVGMVGVYIEFKTPGFGAPGIIGIIAFAFYFLGGYIAGLSGLEWVVVFAIGLTLLVLELFVFPGTLFLGLGGAALMLVALVMAMVDWYPGMPSIPSFSQFEQPLLDVLLAATAALVIMMVLSRFVLRTPLFRGLVSQTASGMTTLHRVAQEQTSRMGEMGLSISALRPGGKAQFGTEIIDVISQGELIPKGAKVRIIRFSGREAVVEQVDASS